MNLHNAVLNLPTAADIDRVVKSIPSWADFCTVFEDPFSTLWWFGETYHKQFGDKRPYEGEDPPEGYVYATGAGLQTALLCAVLISILRFAFERFLGGPLGELVGVRTNAQGTPPGKNEVLETMFKSAKYKKPKEGKVDEAAQVTGLTVREVEVWMRRRQREVMPSKLTKFKESFWRCAFYTFAFSYGISILWGEDYFWETKLCWVGFPERTWGMKQNVYNYYLLEASFYLSLMISQFMDTKRKDFWEMFIHHIATLTLISLSFFGGCVRMGALVMVTHDCADIFLEFAKCSIYAGRKSLADVGFLLFAISFFVTRLVIYPFRIVFCAIVECAYIIPNWPMHTIQEVLLIVLQALHILWFSYIVKLLIKVITDNENAKGDERSQDEAEDSTDEEKEKKGEEEEELKKDK